MSQLPSSWARAPIGSVCVETEQVAPAIEVEFTYVDIGSVDRFKKKVIAPQRLLGKDAPSRARKRIRVGDTIVSTTRPNLNAVALVDQSLDGQIASTGFEVLRAPGLDPRWLGYLVRTSAFVDAMNSLVQGALYPAVRGKDVRSFVAPIAPGNEQKRIADKLDTLVARVDAVNTCLARVAAILKRFRQSVLATATSGRLTEDWREANPRSSAWADCQIGDLLREKPRNGYSPKAVDHETPVRSLTLSATTTGRFRPECFKFVPDEISPDSHLWIAKGDVLIQRANSLEYVGVSAVVDVELDGYIYPDLMMKCRADERTSSAFLHLLLSSADIRRHFREHTTGTAGNMPKINQQTVISAPCRVPTINEQTEIVRRVEMLFGYADRLEARLQAAQTAAERLTPALLAKAFRGELVPQDPNDEPASELLRRLQQEAPATSTRRGRKSAA